MSENVTAWIEATDPVIRFGIAAQLNQSSRLAVVAREQIAPETVVIVAADTVTDEVLQRARLLAKAGCTRFVLVTGSIDDAQLRATVELGICAVVERKDTTPAKLEQLVLKAVQGESALPTPLLTMLFRKVSDFEHNTERARNLPFAGLTTRESQVLRLVADGLDTNEIATRLSYSSRTVKNILHAVMTRFCLRNRSHAVAYAMREGLI